MHVRVWNAYASNNSGSYTIVGRLPSVEVAERVADELRSVVDAHTSWREAWDGETSLDASPLAAFCKKHGLTWNSDQGGWDDWPEHRDDNRPSVLVAGRQLIVHHPYTVSLPTAIGEMFYKHGGRVEHEENHAHRPLTVLAGFWWPWTDEGRALKATEPPRIVARLTARGGVLEQQNHLDCPPVWRVSDAFDSPPLEVAAIFDDLLGGVAGLRAAAEAHGATLDVRLSEAPDVEDPLRHLRPSSPLVARFDVVLIEGAPDSVALRRALSGNTSTYETRVDELLNETRPTIAARALVEPRARELAAALEHAGARVEVRESEDA